MKAPNIAVLVVALAACQAGSAARVDHGLLRLGVATRVQEDSSGHWCAAFDDTVAAPTMRVGHRMTLVWADSAAHRASAPATVVLVRPGLCDAPRADSLETMSVSAVAYELAIDDSVRLSARMPVALALAGPSVWRSGPNRWAYGDGDGDGTIEVARACTSNEGVHLTLWAQRTGRAPVRRAHAYHYLGYDLEPTCTDEETAP